MTSSDPTSVITTTVTPNYQSCSPESPHENVDADSVDLLHKRITYLETQLEIEKAQSAMQKKECDHVRGGLRATMVTLNKEREKTRFSIEQFKDSDSDICYYTGFPTYQTLHECYRLLNQINNIMYICHGKKRILKAKSISYLDQFFMILVRLRLGLFVGDLAQRFSISTTSVNRYFTAWINYMYLRLGSINIWPSKDYIISTMPESMKEKYSNLEWIIDAFEMQIQRPASLLLQSQSYSNYKSRNTVKGLVACTPSGQVGFVSQLYTGNISDRELTVRSGFLNMPHNKGAMWLVDKGFQIADLAEPLGVSVNKPCFVGDRKQMRADEVFHTHTM